MVNKNLQLHHADNLEIMATLPNESIDIICIDPPYLYLKNQKLERAFDEPKFFRECHRLLTKKGFIVMFGRGISFYRWNTLLAEMVVDTKTGETGYLQKDFYGEIISPPHHKSVGSAFKEEIVWDKRKITSPVLALGRRHELAVIYSKGKGVINNVKVDFFEKHKYEPEKIQRTVERIATTFGNRETFALLKKYYETGEKVYTPSVESKFNATRSKDSNINQNRTVVFAVGLEEGVKEQSIIQVTGDHYNTIHPTQKPVKLIERLLNLVIEKDKQEIVVADFFAGSGSTMEAVLNLQEQNPEKTFKGIATEIDAEYFEGMKNRIEKIQPDLFGGSL